MEKQETIGFIEVCLRIINNDLKHFKLCLAIVLIPTLVAFVMVMWVIEPTYRATAIVTPPGNSQSSFDSGVSGFLGGGGKSGGKGGLAGAFGSLLSMSSGDEDADVVWTILNSRELHDQIIEKFDLGTHYEFEGKFHADLLKEFRRNFSFESNDENMFEISVEDKDFNLAAEIITFLLEKADSSFNAYKTSQARQSKEYFELRLDSCEQKLDSLLENFSKFQAENDFYDPEVQIAATLHYLGELQSRREDISMEMAYEKVDRGEDSKRYDQLSKRYQGVNSALKNALNGKNGNVGMVPLRKSPELSAKYLQYKSEIKVQEALLQMLRAQKEEMQLEEAKMLTNLHVLEAPWANDKKVFPRRGLILSFVFFVSTLFATALCSFIAFIDEEKKKNSLVGKEWESLYRRLCFWRK
ncbi:MAG: Wzz/FepE/Etk N-terminal domain-containing protein [Fibrobacter sp.]|nr:Wzz/FepE/Etk N-terminal domain-containing protein [Fibrobacter sp.]